LIVRGHVVGSDNSVDVVVGETVHFKLIVQLDDHFWCK